jgi:hypothetical protein
MVSVSSCAQSAKSLPSLPVLGQFGKGKRGSRTLNFSRCGGSYCSQHCAQWAFCYGKVVEKRKPSVNKALTRREEAGPEAVAQSACRQLGRVLAKGEQIPWFRFSAFGSVPPRELAPAGFPAQLRKVADLLDAANIPAHFPIEEAEKAAWYAEALEGSNVFPRLTCQNEREWLTHQGPVSTVAGKHLTLQTVKRGQSVRKARLKHAQELAQERRKATGRTVVICPAILATWFGKRPVHCGDCTACARRNVDVIYPRH